MPGIMTEGPNSENRQTTARHRLWHRRKARLELNTGSALSMRTDSVLPEDCDRT